ncbi:MAG: hypothetical protein QF573_10575 [Chloroflexota bacterium]|jgi:hypothetical protein|nr:hypothetical protein [Chloroflexota bacterium]
MSVTRALLQLLFGARPPLRILLGYLLPLLVLYRRLLFEGHAGLDLDFLIAYRPRLEILQSGLHSAQLPVWTDTYLSGFPVAYSEYGWFYPLTWLFLRIFPMPFAYHAEAALGVLLAALAAYALGRAWGLQRLPAFVAGYLYAFAPFVFATTLFLNFATVFFVLPAAILAIERIAQGRRWFILLLASVVGINILAGHPHISVLLAFGASLYGIFRAVWIYRDNGVVAALRLVVLLGFAAALGLLLGAVRLLPLLVITGESTRAGGIDFGTAAAGAIHPLALLLGYAYPAFDLPRVFDGVLKAEPLAYLGLLALPLAVLAIARRWRQRTVIFLTVMTVLSWILAFGDTAPAFRALHSLPLFGFFRIPSRFILLAGFALAFLAAFGLQTLRTPGPAAPPVSRWFARVFAAYGVFLALAVVATTAILEINYGPLRNALNRGIDRFLVGGAGAYATLGEWQGMFAGARQRLEQAFTLLSWTPVFTAILALAAALAWRRLAAGRWSSGAATTFLALFLILDLTFSMGHGIETVSAETLDAEIRSATLLQNLGPTRVLSFRGLADKWELSMTGRDELFPPDDRDRLEYLFLREVITPDLASRSGLTSIDGYENLMTQRQAEVLAYLGSERSTVRGFAVSATESEESKAATLRDRLPALAAFNVGAVLSGTNLDAALGPPAYTVEVEIPARYEADQTVWIYLVPEPLGDYYLTNNWRLDDPAEPTDSVLDRLLRSPPGLVTLDADPGLPDAPGPATGSFEVLDSGPGRHVLRVHADAPTVLVVNRSHLPGWSVALNQYPIAPLVANRFAVAVAIPAGSSTVALAYTPPDYPLGAQLSLAALAVLVTLAIIAYRRSRPPAEDTRQ